MKLDKHFNALGIDRLMLGSLGVTICESLFGDGRFKFGMSALFGKLFSLMLLGVGRLGGFWVFCVLLGWLSGWISGKGGLLTVNVGLSYLQFLNAALPDPSILLHTTVGLEGPLLFGLFLCIVFYVFCVIPG